MDQSRSDTSPKLTKGNTASRGAPSKKLALVAAARVASASAALRMARRKALVTHFGSVARLRQASVEEITAVPGIGVATAAAVREALDTASDRGGSDAAADAVGDDAQQAL